MRAVHRAANKVCSSSDEKRTFIKLGSLIMRERCEDTVEDIFSVMSGDLPLQELPGHIQLQLPKTMVDNSAWKAATSWTQWWMRPIHLSM